MNLEHGTELAKFQDSLVIYLKENPESVLFDKDIIKRLKSNLWIKLSSGLAKSNLVVRQLCLIDIISGKAKNSFNIMWAMKSLTDEDLLWSEGYSYWEYTREVLELYVKFFESNNITRRIYGLSDSIDLEFIKTGYLRNGIIYPAPFGDLRDIPLRSKLQQKEYLVDIVNCEILSKNNNIYLIRPFIVGGNTHTPSKTQKIRVVDGIPLGFKFYEGYDKKFKSKTEELFNVTGRILRS